MKIESNDKEFDPSKAAILQGCYIYLDKNEENALLAFIYDEKSMNVALSIQME